MNTTNNTLELNLLRRLALMQHLGEAYFIVNGIAYEGSEEDAQSELDSEFEEEIENIHEVNGMPVDGEKISIPSFEDWCKVNCTEIEELDEDDYTIDYMVLTDEEADEKWEESLDSYIEDCITPELKKIDGLGNLSDYIKFDEDMWKRDARMDGRGHSLSSYDGNENEEEVEGVTFYIYRTN